MITYHPYDQATVDALRCNAPDAYGNRAERDVSTGHATPCRSCLRNVPKDAAMLICAARPFSSLHAYAETGPIFLCAEVCTPYDGQDVPDVLQNAADYLVKGYDGAERIVAGTGQITSAHKLASYAETLLAMDAVAFVDVRSARNNCFLTRITVSE